ncbi:flagellar hook protein FlgE [Methylobacterium indicum]|uniref:Flagellar hook protein FlgE n=1 Tax=Methylobacterium indicum TaxID=1775910 RepID=A0A0J6REV4_9HYPH|nr:flagellar hook protein FlgE [Methylobacterium indicum]KMO19767.1 flagellar hook protein FlgE [Methylobacterium indicum]KMO25517.1 flagellar hook protein FlgE [Methylobacterium indicum]KTS32371.1 flagellar hook protein FlgE [Methylobacterium indicum]KTS40607.1 flagellar hook protein FlgE [Methylobacterium indicum]KTS52886.1 flagellar hook protein FlgE [Methylobacterium indicum]
MSLIGVLRSGVSGMNAQSNRISTVAENIQNSGTTGYKRSSAEFSSLLIADSAGGNYNSGSVETKVRRAVTEGGTLNATTSKSDLAIDGNGFFVVKDPSGAPYLTRAGNFKVDGVTGNFSNAAGMTLMGYSLLDGEPNPTLNSVADMVPINLSSVSTRATPTTEASLSGKLPLDADVAAAGQYSKKYSLVTYDKLGKAQTLDVYLSKNTGGTWTASIYNAATDPTPAGSTPALPSGTRLAAATLSFDAQGRLADAGGAKSITLNTAPGNKGENITLDFSGLNQLAGDYSVDGKADGKAPAAVTGTEFGADGTVYASFEDGTRLAAFKVPLATVKSPDNLQPRSGNVYQVSVDSGDIQVGFANQNGRGGIKSGALEQSNVDVSTELTAMIESQSVYTANSKVFTTGNEMLDTLMNLKR